MLLSYFLFPLGCRRVQEVNNRTLGCSAVTNNTSETLVWQGENGKTTPYACWGRIALWSGCRGIDKYVLHLLFITCTTALHSCYNIRYYATSYGIKGWECVVKNEPFLSYLKCHMFNLLWNVCKLCLRKAFKLCTFLQRLLHSPFFSSTLMMINHFMGY